MRSILAAASAALMLLALAGPAQADFDLTGFSSGFRQPSGEPVTQAGAHADMVTEMDFASAVTPEGTVKPDQQLRDVHVELPPGFYGNPQAVATCRPAELATKEGFCNPDAQVGVLTVQFGPDPSEPGGELSFGLYNMPVGEGETATLAAGVIGAVVKVSILARTDSDNGLEARLSNVNQALGIFGARLTIWGVPASPVHTPERFQGPSQGGASSGLPLRPFATMPARCEPLTTTVHARSWQNPDRWVTASVTTPALSGCDSLQFGPLLDVSPALRQPGTPSGFDIDLSIPQDQAYSGLGTPQLRRVVIQLPEGVTISPGVAAGLVSCPDAQLALGSRSEPSCPAASRIGTLAIETPVLPDPLEGEVIVGAPTPAHLFRLFLVARGSGVIVKVPGIVQPDEVSGRLTAVFDNAPQLSFSAMHLHLKGGPQAPLTTPPRCGDYSTHAEFTSWATPTPVVGDSSFRIDGDCGAGGRFSPNLRAGSGIALGGATTPFHLQVLRDDREEDVSRIEATLPEGLLAKLGGVPLCGDGPAAAGACPPQSRIGTATVGVGPGPAPLYLPQPSRAPTGVYLASPYKGAPYSLVVEVPAQAGPFDLGTVAVRSRIDLDPVTTRVTVASDPLPQILRGVPVAYRDIGVAIDRPDFTRNPTSCEPLAVEAKFASVRDQVAAAADRFQVGGCGTLGFKPRLSLKLSGPTHRHAYPKLRAVLRARKGDANIGRVAVTLPPTEFLENDHIKTICTRVQYAAKDCPTGSIYGRATAWSPLLDRPLHGPVYLRSSSHALPDLVAALDGPIQVDLAGRIDSVDERLRTVFWALPDAPVSKFLLTMRGGKKGLLVNNTELCGTTPRADARLDAQNGKAVNLKPLAKIDCGLKGRKAKRR